jgi:hypothetical protein
VITSVSGNAIGRSCFRILTVNCDTWSADVHRRMPLSRAVVTQLVTRLGLDELAELKAPEATTHFTLWCTGQTVVLGGLASGLANAVFVAAVVTDRVNERSYAHRYRPEDGDDEEDLCLVLADDATRARRDHHRRHTGDKDADRNTG